MKIVGVLALQGAVTEHLRMLTRLQVKAVAVKQVNQLAELDGLIIPGGESTAISRLIQQQGLYHPIQQFASTRPILGTCAGLILSANQIVNGDGNVMPLRLIDITVERNGFGRQIESFETKLSVTGIVHPVPAIFIRAPFIRDIGPDVRVLATLDDKIVMAESSQVLVTAFHPELTEDTQLFEYFLSKIG